MQTLFYIIQIVLSMTLIGVILLQVKNAGLGGAFGGSDASIYTTRRGVDLVLYRFTIILSVIFVVTSLIVLRVTG